MDEEQLKNNPQEDLNTDEQIRGRAAMLNRFREGNPDYEGNPNDDDLYDYAIKKSDEYKSKYDKQNEINAALAERISEDPRLGALIAGIMEKDEKGNRKNPAYVVAKLYGKDFLDDEDALESLDKGYAEYLEGVKQTEAESKKAQENFLESMQKVDTYGKENGLTEEQIEELRQSLVTSADEILSGVFSDMIIETVAKGLSYDADVQEASDTGYVEGKNENISVKFNKSEGDMPSMGSTTKNPRQIEKKEPERRSFFDGLKPVE